MYLSIFIATSSLLTFWLSLSPISTDGQQARDQFVHRANYQVDINSTTEKTGLCWNQDEFTLSPITKLFLKVLREYGAYIIDDAGGFVFYVEDIYSGSLDLTDSQVNTLTGVSGNTPIPSDKTKWQLVIEKLAEEINNLPVASGPWDDGQNAAETTMSYANFELVGGPEIPPP